MPPKRAGTFGYYERQHERQHEKQLGKQAHSSVDDEEERTHDGFASAGFPILSQGPRSVEAPEPSTRRNLELSRDSAPEIEEIYEEETATSRRPMDAYEKWLSERHLNDSKKTDKGFDKNAEAKSLNKVETKDAVPVAKPALQLSRDSADSSPSLEIEIVDAPRDLSGPWEVPIAEDFEAKPESKDDQTRAGLPRAYPMASGFVPRNPAQIYAQPIPQPPLVPRLATPQTSFPPNAGYMMHSSAPPAMMPQQYMQAPLQQQYMVAAPQPYMPAPQYANAYAGASQVRPHSPHGPTTPPSRAYQHVPLTQQVSTQSSTDSSRQVHRAPWFCLGLAVGVASMVIAFFLPTSHSESSASAANTAPLPTMQIPTARAPAAVTAPMQASNAAQLSQATGQATQLGIPVNPAPIVTAAATATTNVGGSKPVPTVDVHSLPVAAQKEAAQAPVAVAQARRVVRAPVRAQVRRAAPPKPIPQDDDDALSSSGPAVPAPTPAPAVKAAPAQEPSLSGDVLLQAL